MFFILDLKGSVPPVRQTTILLLDCNLGEHTGETLETMLTTARLGATLRREIITDASQMWLDRDWCGARAEFRPALIFLLLPPAQTAAGGALLQALKSALSDVPVIVVTEACGPVETLELLQQGAADFITPPLRVADTLPRVWRLLTQLTRRESIVQTLLERVGLKLLIGQTANFLAEVKKIPLIAR